MKTNEEMVIDRDEAIKQARQIVTNPYYIVDTETTGLYDAQMCQFATVNNFRLEASYMTYIKPTIPIEPGAEAVHHISNEMVELAPDAKHIIPHILTEAPMVIYNAPFDTKVILNSLAAVGAGQVIFPEIYDAMQIYSNFRGEWNDYYGNYKWHKLEVACNQCGIVIDLKLHDALSDCIMTDKLIHYIAEQKLSTEK